MAAQTVVFVHSLPFYRQMAVILIVLFYVCYKPDSFFLNVGLEF